MQRVNGFTLLELIFTLSLLIVVLTLGIPALSQWVQRSKVTGLQYTLLHSIHYARTQATQLQSTVTLCPGTSACEDTWGSNLLIFNDSNRNGVQDNDEILLKKIGLGSLSQDLNWRSFRRKPYLQFNSQGLTAALNGTFHFCPDDPTNELEFSIILARTGRVRISDTPNCP